MISYKVQMCLHLKMKKDTIENSKTFDVLINRLEVTVMLKTGKRLLEAETVRYIVTGIATTGVNLLVFFLLRSVIGMNLNTSNFIAILLAILFAYVGNKCFVFRAKTASTEQLVQEAMNFFGARLLTMVFEMIGVAFFIEVFRVQEMFSKIAVQVLILVCNYIFSKRFIFNDTKEKNMKWNKRTRFYMLTFLLPFFILLICCMIFEVQPFGDFSLVIIDGLHQYMPFFSAYQEKLQQGQSLFYSFQSGLGINFMALWAYYLASPLNLLIIAFPQKYLNGVVSMLIIIKISLASVTMAIYLKNAAWRVRATYEVVQKDWQILIFAMAYALSSYMLGYSWNVMWLETMIFFPLIILGLEKLIEKKDGRLYCFMLFVSLSCNFYMTFMTCLFLVFYFLLYDHKGIKEFIKRGFSFAGYSLLAGAMAGVILLPTYCSLMLTSSAKMQFPKPELYVSFFDTINSHSIGAKVITNAQGDGGTNLYCGILTILCIWLYAMNRKIKWTTRIKQIIFVLFLLVSFNVNWLNYVWHGFHDQYGIPNRFAYLYIFMCICMAYQVLLWIKNYRPFHIIWSFWITMGIIVLSILFSDAKETWYSYGITAMVALIYTILLCRYTGWKLKGRYMPYLLGSMMILELGFHTIFSYYCTGQVSISKFFQTTEEMQNAKSIMELDTDWYRAELAKAKMLDEVTWNRLNGVSLFGSTAIGNVVTTMGKLGFYTGVNEYLYRGATPVTNSILGVRYLFVRQGDTVDSSFTYYKSIGNIDLYKNYEALPLGYMVSEQVKQLNVQVANPFDVQNSWVSATLGKPIEVFKKVETIQEPILNQCKSTSKGSDYLSYEVIHTADDNIVYTIVPEKDMDLYLYITGNQIERMLIQNNTTTLYNEKLNSQVVSVGNVKEGIPITISLRMKTNPNTGQVRIMAAAFQEEAFMNYYKEMIQQPYEVEEHKDGYIKGTVRAKQDGILFTSIPYDIGWNVFVDGKEVEKQELLPVADAFLGIPLEAGVHEVILDYTPIGFKEGLFLSIGGGIGFIGCHLYHNSYKKRRNEKNKKILNSVQ